MLRAEMAEIEWTKRELERQSKRISMLGLKLDETINAVNSIQEILNGATRKEAKEKLTFKAKIIEKEET